jgi:hypothetical protein
MLLKNAVRNIVLPLLAGLLAIWLLTMAAYHTVASWRGMIPENIVAWAQDGRVNRFDDFSDGVVLANVLYVAIIRDFSPWVYFVPASSPIDGWKQFLQALTPQNHPVLNREYQERRGFFLHRYWTGHMVMTALYFAVFPDLRIASHAISAMVLVTLIVFLLAWSRSFGMFSAMFVAAFILGSGLLPRESFHDHAFNAAVAFAAAAYTAHRISTGKSTLAPAVLGAVFGNWVGYDYVFDTVGLSILFFLVRRQDEYQVESLYEPLKFVGVFLGVTALMMALRVPVVILSGHDVNVFVDQTAARTVERLAGDVAAGQAPPGAVTSRTYAILSALPVLNFYLFRLGGVLIPQVTSVVMYWALQILPILGILGLDVYRKKSLDGETVKRLGVIILAALMFHVMQLIFVNHACVHPWMDVRHMVLSFAILWGLFLANLVLAIRSRRPAPRG